MLAAASTTPATAAERPRWAIAVHGGAGIIERKAMTPELDAAFRAALERAARTGSAVLDKGGSSLDAIEAVIREFEDDPLFNAGRGAVFTAEGTNEHDASIMNGADLAAGAVAGLTTTRHPISLARKVMETSPHVMMIGKGAEAFGRTHGLEQVEPAWFFTERRWQSLIQELTRKGEPIPPRPVGAPPKPVAAIDHGPDDHRFGTVGVVALDAKGNIAAGTSTGGMTAKKWNRVGDAPIIGAGTYASNRSCAVSGTGWGEYFIRLTVAREICALVEYKGISLQAAADEVIRNRLRAMGGDGGVVAITPDGTIAWSFTDGMYRAKATSASPTPLVAIYGDEP